MHRYGSGTFRAPLSFSAFRRFVRRAAGLPGGANIIQVGKYNNYKCAQCQQKLNLYVTTAYHFNMLMNLKIRQQQCCIICIQFKLRGDKIIRDLNSALSLDQPVLSYWSSANRYTRLQSSGILIVLLDIKGARPLLYETSQNPAIRQEDDRDTRRTLKTAQSIIRIERN